MQFSEHERARRLVDKSLAEGISPDEQQWLDDHTKNCAECAEHAQVSAKIVRGFKAFSFELEPGTNARMRDAVAKRAQVAGVAPRKVSAFPIRRTAIVGAIAAAALLVIVMTKHQPSRSAMTATQHQPVQTQQVAAKENTSAPVAPIASTVSTQIVPAVARIKRRRVAKPLIAETDFIPLDDWPPVIDGTIVRINMPDTFAVHPRHGHKGKTVPAEVLVDEAGLVRAIRFLDEDSR
jgi:hypothetical protein